MNAFYYSSQSNAMKTGKDAFVKYFMRVYSVVIIGCTVIGMIGIDADEPGKLIIVEYLLSILPHFAII